MSDLPTRSQFLEDIDDALGERPHSASEIAVMVINAATANEHAELARVLGERDAGSLQSAAADRIGALLPAQTRLYRLSAVQVGCVLKADAGPLERILDALAYRIPRQTTNCAVPVATTVGIGIACHPRDGATALELLEAACSAAQQSLDSVMPWCAYSPAIDQTSRRAASLLRDIGVALAGGEQLHLVYQPKQDLRSGRCVGAEALVRWRHPTLGPVAPGEFVPLVERTTVVHALTDWVLEAASGQSARWRVAGLDIKLSINISMLDLQDEHFPARLTKLLEHRAVRPHWIDIEVTESALMKDPASVRHQLDALRQLGVGISIDDFGTGRSTLSYLKYIPATEVKIDQLFVARLASNRDDQIIVRSTINLLHELGKRVVAEGIQDEATHRWLREHGCDIGQGDAISPPLDAGQFEQWLMTDRAGR